jgi:hypothetical protein
MIDGDQQWRAVGQSVSYPEGAAMSSHSRKTPRRIGLLAAALWLTAMASAFAQDTPDITLKLSPAQVAEIGRLIDLAAPSTFVSPPPAAYWDLQTRISRELAADPAALSAVLSAGSAVR